MKTDKQINWKVVRLQQTIKFLEAEILVKDGRYDDAISKICSIEPELLKLTN